MYWALLSAKTITGSLEAAGIVTCSFRHYVSVLRTELDERLRYCLCVALVDRTMMSLIDPFVEAPVSPRSVIYMKLHYSAYTW